MHKIVVKNVMAIDGKIEPHVCCTCQVRAGDFCPEVERHLKARGAEATTAYLLAHRLAGTLD